MTLPHFLVLGAARSATTSLHYYLDQHPRITMSMTKEPNFFAFDHDHDPPTPCIDPGSAIITKSVVRRDAYERLFEHAAPGDLLGEASPLYLYVREAPEQIRRFIPQARLLAVVRNPVDRAYSHWTYLHRDRPEQVIDGFRAACQEEMGGGGAYSPYAGGSHVLRLGLYDRQLGRYVDTFGRDALLVLTHEEVTREPASALARICDHLGIEGHDFDTDVQYNRSGVAGSRLRGWTTSVAQRVQPRVKAMLPARTAARLGRWRATRAQLDAPPTLPEDLRSELVAWFRPSVDALRGSGLVEVDPWEDFA